MMRAKMKCVRAEAEINSEGKQYQEQLGFTPVYGKAGTVNGEWSRWTPSGAANFVVTNPALFGKYEVGKCYYFDVTPAPAEYDE